MEAKSTVHQKAKNYVSSLKWYRRKSSEELAFIHDDVICRQLEILLRWELKPLEEQEPTFTT